MELLSTRISHQWANSKTASKLSLRKALLLILPMQPSTARQFYLTKESLFAALTLRQRALRWHKHKVQDRYFSKEPAAASVML
jgi:hypothetical protein